METVLKHYLRLIVSLWIVGLAKKIINADIVKAGEPDQNLSWNVICADFIFGISGLRHAQIVGNLLLI